MTIVFYQKDATVYAVQYQTSENSLDVSKLEWLFSGAHKIQGDALKGYFIGPRREKYHYLPGMHLVIGGHAIGYILTGSSVI